MTVDPRILSAIIERFGSLSCDSKGAAEFLGLSHNSFQRWRAAGRVKPFMRDRFWYTDLIEAQHSPIIPREDNIIELTQDGTAPKEPTTGGRAFSGDGRESQYRKAQALLQSHQR